jgi:hypothetical protein
MRGTDAFTESLLLMKRLDTFVNLKYPLRATREIVNKFSSNLIPVKTEKMFFCLWYKNFKYRK